MPEKKKTGIVRDPRYAGHCMGPGQPECPERLEVLYAMLDEPGLQGHFQDITPRSALTEELLQVHSADHIRRLETTAGIDNTYLDPDTCTCAHSHEAALLAAGGICQAIQQVYAGDLDNAFALVRPPGHHAERTAAKGFCLYNNVAIGARYAQRTLGLKRILVVDWDLHHGNGTQHCFEDDPSVLFFSTHRSFFYPGGGSVREAGKGRGKGFTINLPLLPGLGDGEYLCLFDEILKPIALAFRPDLVLVSAGFDIHCLDPMGGMRVTPKGFAAMTRCILDIAEQCCQGRVVLALEGGYHLEALRDSVREVLKELAGLQLTDTNAVLATADRKKVNDVIWRVKRVHRKYWKALAAPGADGQEPVPPLLQRAKGAADRIIAYLKS
jgi:acetoin utilization deacetylase AcuC-like enzyme